MIDDVEAILKGADGLGALPAAYRRLCEALDAPTIDAKRVAAAVRVDPVMTARLLSVANREGGDVQTVTEAAIRLTKAELTDVVVHTTMLRLFRGMPEHLLDMRSFWEHSVAVALASHLLARHSGLMDAEPIFVAGLLHDLGSLLLCVARPRDARRVLVAAENEECALDVVERRLLGFDHAEVGASLMETWGLPELHVQAARFHHRPSEAAPEHQASVDLIHLADVMVSALQIGNAGERAAHALDTEAWERAGLQPANVERLLEELQEEHRTLTAALLED